MKAKCIGGSSNGRLIDLSADAFDRGYIVLRGPSISPTEFINERYVIKELRRQLIDGCAQHFVAVFDEMPEVCGLDTRMARSKCAI